VRRLLAALSIATALACATGRPAVRPPLFPLQPVWKTLVGDFVEPPLATNGRLVFVATRDGVVRALDPATGEVAWKVDGVPGVLSAGEDAVFVRGSDGTVSSLEPQTGALRWRAPTGVEGTLPVLADGDRVLVAGKGLASADAANGRVLWVDASGAAITAPPVRAGARVLTGDADGTLRSRDRATGAAGWALPTGSPLLAPPLVDEARRRVYVGTTDKRILEVKLETGRAGWRWVVGADVVQPGRLVPGQVLFAGHDAVLYSLRPGGNLDWRAPLPSRPLSGPITVEGRLLVACLENEIVAVEPDKGRPAGAFRTPAEIRSPPLLVEGLLVVALRDRSVVAYRPAAAARDPGQAPSAVEPPSEPPTRPPG
jgi:outer membrane protein assembly factor BamB